MGFLTMKSNPKSASNIYQDKNFYIINALTLMAILGGTIFNPALPSIQKTFNVSSEQVSLVSTLFQLPGAIVTPIFGILADSFGRKQVLLPSLLLFAIGGGFSGFAPNFRSLLEGRLLQGIGVASLESLSLTIISDVYRGKMLTTVMAFNASLIGISSALFPVIGGVLAALSWRFPFLVSFAAIAIALLVLTTLKLPNRQQTKDFKLKLYLRSTWSSINNRQVFGLLFAAMSQFLLQVASITYIPILAGSLGASSTVNGLILASISLSLAFTASQLGLFARKLSEIKLIKISFILFALALAIIPIVPNVWLLLIPMMLLGAAQGMAFPSTQALLAGLSAQESRAGFMAVNSTIQSLGQTLGPLLAAIVDAIWGIQVVFYAAAGFALVSFVVFNLMLASTQQVVAPSPQPTPQSGAGLPVIQPATSPLISTSPTILQTVEFAPPPAPTIVQLQTARLIHIQTERAINLPQLSLTHIGKPNERIPPDVDVSKFPNSQVVSRVHADIRVEGDNYYLQDLNSSNGTYINNYPLLPGNWYKLRAGDRISFGKGDLVKFLFQLS